MNSSLKFAASLSAVLTLAGCGSDVPDQTMTVSQSGSARQVVGAAGVMVDNGRIGSGIAHVVALRTDGTLVAWGSGQYGQLGEGNAASLVPVPVQGLSHVTEVRTGGFHTAVITSDQRIWTWGNNSYGQAGVGGLSTVMATPRKVSGLSDVKSVGAGYSHTSAVAYGGVLWTWGQMPGRASTTPVKVGGSSKQMTSVAAGGDFTLALAADGTVFGWGGNTSGQLGIGYASPNVVNLVQVAGLTNVKSLAAGKAHALALRTDGSVYAWGNNQNGQLSTAGPSNRARPVLGLPTPLSPSSVRGVYAGAVNSAVVYADGSVWMWGNNVMGQFGNGTTTGSTVPVKLNNLPDVAAITIGQTNVSVLKKDGTVYSMGGNQTGQLGNNTLVPSTTPVQVVGLSGVGYINIGASSAP